MPLIISEHLIKLLDQAVALSNEFRGGYAFYKDKLIDAQDFHKMLSESVQLLKSGDPNQLEILRLWFAPTGYWDDLVGRDGMDLANDISDLLAG